MSSHQLQLPGMEGPRRITKSETFGAVQQTFVAVLRQRGQATADALREFLDIPPSGWPAIGRAIADLHRQRIIELVEFGVSHRGPAHGRALRIWRLAPNKKSPTGQA